MKSMVCFLVALAVLANLSAQPFTPPAGKQGTLVTARSLTFNPELRPFYHGVASGDPTASSVVLWTRVTPEESLDPIPVTYRVATDLDFSNVVASGTLTAAEATDYTVKVLVADLAPATTYYYYFTALDLNSLIGRAKTAPAGGVDHLRFGVMSCANYEGGYFNAYGTLAERNDLDAVIHLGDYIYEYGAGVYGVNLPERVNEPTSEILTLTDYRTRYSLYRLDPDLIRAHQQHTFITIWDDHESANDSYVDGAENHQPEEGSWEERKAISRQVYFEWMPIQDSNEQNIYRKLSYGDLCDLIMIDTRLEGREAPPVHFDTPDVPPRNIISATQFDWLTNNLRNSSARWKVIGNQVLFSTFNVGFAAGAFDGVPDLTNIDSIRAAEDLFIDNWESYPTQRNAIIDTLRVNDIDNTVIISGDSHASWAFDVTTDAVLYPLAAAANLPQPNPYDSATQQGYNPLTGEGSWAVEFGTPSVSSPNFDEAIGAALTAQFEFLMTNPIPQLNLVYNPHAKYVDLDRHGYFILDLTVDTAQANYYYIESQLIDTLLESFGQGVFTVQGENYLQLTSTPSPGKEVQDTPTPTTPYIGAVAVGEVKQNVALFSLYPNPASEQVFLQFGVNEATSLQIKVYDAQGKVVLTESQSQFAPGLYQYGLRLNRLVPGWYTLSLESPNGQTVSRKLIVR